MSGKSSGRFQFSFSYEGSEGLLDFLGHEAWRGMGVVVSSVTLVVTMALAVWVALWTNSQGQAHLYVHPPKWTASEDLASWEVEVVVDNDGPATATDVRVEVRLSIHDPGVSLKALQILSDGEPIPDIREGSDLDVPWSLPESEGGRLTDALGVSPYVATLDRLAVGGRIVVRAVFSTDQAVGEELAKTLQREDCVPVSNPKGAGPEWWEYARAHWRVLHVRTLFVQDVKVSGNRVAVARSNLWTPMDFR